LYRHFLENNLLTIQYFDFAFSLKCIYFSSKSYFKAPKFWFYGKFNIKRKLLTKKTLVNSLTLLKFCFTHLAEFFSRVASILTSHAIFDPFDQRLTLIV